MKKYFAFFVLLLLTFVQSSVFAEPNVIRFATVVPEGTSWLKEMNQLAADIQKETKGQVELKIYSSSKMGDELDVIRKMRSGQLHAGAFSGLGLGSVQPAIRVLELPFLFHSTAEIDKVQEKLFDTLSKRFAEKDMVLIATSEAGDVHIFSKTPIRSRADLNGAKMWLWEGDPLAKAFYEAARVVPVPLPITEVITGLQTGMVNGVYAPPMALIGFQWWTKVSAMTKPNLNLSIGGMLVTKKKWATISPQNQKIILDLSRQAGKRITAISRADNESAIETLKKNNISVVEMDEAAKKDFYGIADQLGKDLSGKLYDRGIYEQVNQILADYRSGKKS